MRRYLCVCGLILACGLVSLAQEKQTATNVKDKPDLTGSWLLNRVKSKAGQAVDPDLPLKITHRDPELKITHLYDQGGQIVEREFIYYSDGRGETNPATMLLSISPNTNSQNLEKRVTNSKTRWSGRKLVTRSLLRNSIAGHMLEFEIVTEWKLSDDGATLLETRRTDFRSGSSNAAFIPAGVPETKIFYSRLPN